MYPGSRFHHWEEGEPTNRMDSVDQATRAAFAVFYGSLHDPGDTLEVIEVDLGDLAGLGIGRTSTDVYVRFNDDGTCVYLPDHDPYAPKPGVDYTLTDPGGLSS